MAADKEFPTDKVPSEITFRCQNPEEEYLKWEITFHFHFQRFFAMDGQDFRNVPVYRGAVKVLMQEIPETKKFHILVDFE